MFVSENDKVVGSKYSALWISCRVEKRVCEEQRGFGQIPCDMIKEMQLMEQMEKGNSFNGISRMYLFPCVSGGPFHHW